MPPTTTAILAIAGLDPPQLTKRITTAYPTANPVTSQPWTLSHTLYRTNPLSPPQQSQPSSTDYLHMLQLSTYPLRTFLCTSSDTAATRSIAIPQGAATADFRRLLQDRFGLLWQAVRQGETHVAGGTSWEVGMFRVQVGELLRERGAGGGVERRGVLVVVSFVEEEDGSWDASDDVQLGTELLMDLCAGLGLSEAQGAKVLAEARGSRATWQQEADLLCQVLKKLGLGGVAPRSRQPE